MTWKLPLSVEFPNQLKSQHSIHLLHLALKTVDLAWKGLHSPEFEQNFSDQSLIYISRIHFFGCACLKKPLVARSWYSRVTSFTACWATHQFAGPRPRNREGSRFLWVEWWEWIPRTSVYREIFCWDKWITVHYVCLSARHQIGTEINAKVVSGNCRNCRIDQRFV